MMNRREFLKALAVGGVTVSLPAVAIGKALSQAPPGTLGIGATQRDPIHHVISRLTYGVTPELYQHVQNIGIEAFLDEQLNPQRINDADTDARLPDIIGLSTAELVRDYADNPAVVVRGMIEATITRARYSNRGLFERMVYFWSNHFNVYIRKAFTYLLKPAEDRDVMRVHALGTFGDLLQATAKSPALLFYLDNFQSNANNPNENYARELLELHTLGVDGGYTETDVKETARIFTGWSLGGPRDRQNAGNFVYRAILHDPGEKVVLGRTFPALRGMVEGEELLDMLAQHPSTARFVAFKLVRHFVADNPPNALVEHVAQVFSQSNGDIRSVLRTIFASDEFWQAPPKLKTPMEVVIGMLRALDYQPGFNRAYQQAIFSLLEQMGHIPFTWPAPNGFPDVSAYWMQNLLPRWNAAIHAVGIRLEGHPNYDILNTLIGDVDADTALNRVAHYLYGRGLSDAELAFIYDFMDEIGGSEADKAAGSLALMLAAPAFQYR